MAISMSHVLHFVALVAVTEGLRARGRAAAGPKARDFANEAYMFDAFVRDFGRAYTVGSSEYTRREAIFQDSQLQISSKNSLGGRSWRAGVHPFMDWTKSERLERLHGYKHHAPRPAAEVTPLVALQTGMKVARDERSDGQLYGGAGDSFEAAAPAVQEQDQYGKCGSCWAFAAAGAVEARLKRMDSPLLKAEPRISVQALLDCVPQHNACHGGCLGSSPQNAFDFMREQGVPLEENVPYDPMHTGQCPIKPYPLDWVRVSLSGWRSLPSNQAQPVMQALVNDGPVAVTADAHNWYDYASGIFDDCDKNAVPNHSLLVRGYGIENGKKYWTVQNSWGTRWGEMGAIRLLRQDDSSSWCGIDSEKDGIECDGPGHTNVTVCGTCGLLYSPAVPEIGFIMLGPGPSAADEDLEPEAATGRDAFGSNESALAAEMPFLVPSTMQATSASANISTFELVSKQPIASEHTKVQELAQYFSSVGVSSDMSMVTSSLVTSNAAGPADVVPVEIEKTQGQMESDAGSTVTPPLASISDNSMLTSGYSAADAVDAYLRR